MIITRPSVKDDIPAMKELWKLAFGDTDPYINNFFSNYYRESRVLILEKDGKLLSMAAWFPCTMDAARLAYIYALATHPDENGRGYGSQLLTYCNEYLKNEQHFMGVTTVPATQSLHTFFAKNGYFDYFTHTEEKFIDVPVLAKPRGVFTRLPASIYHKMRHEFLKTTHHVVMDLSAIAHQDNICLLTNGGLYRYDYDERICILVIEQGVKGVYLVKEILGFHKTQAAALADLPTLVGCNNFVVRRPQGDTAFGMLQWFNESPRFDRTDTAYLGLAFD